MCGARSRPVPLLSTNLEASCPKERCSCWGPLLSIRYRRWRSKGARTSWQSPNWFGNPWTGPAECGGLTVACRIGVYTMAGCCRFLCMKSKVQWVVAVCFSSLDYIDAMISTRWAQCLKRCKRCYRDRKNDMILDNSDRRWTGGQCWVCRLFWFSGKFKWVVSWWVTWWVNWWLLWPQINTEILPRCNNNNGSFRLDVSLSFFLFSNISFLIIEKIVNKPCLSHTIPCHGPRNSDTCAAKLCSSFWKKVTM